MNLPVTFTSGSFSFTPGGDPENLNDAIAAALRANIPGDNVLLGKVGGAAPTDGSLWFTDGTLNYFDGNAYRPTLIKVGNATNYVTLAITNPQAKRTQTLQDKDGTIALLSDITNPRPTRILAQNNHGIDWSLSNSFYYDMGNSSTIGFTNSLPGQEAWLLVRTITSGKTVVFTSDIAWDSGTQPAQTSPGVALYIFRNVAGTITGEVLLDVKNTP